MAQAAPKKMRLPPCAGEHRFIYKGKNRESLAV